MRLAKEPDEFLKLLQQAKSEAVAAFGNAGIYLEKHIEFQVLADKYGNVVHLGEHDYNIRRRNQKLLEEAPSPALTPELREAMGDATVAAAASIAGHGARSETKDSFSRPFRKKDYIPLSTYLKTYKIGDYVDVKGNGAVHKGMPHKFYHGSTGRVWNVTKRVIGVEVNNLQGAPTIQIERKEVSSLPIQIERNEASTLSIQIERKEASTLPIQVERKKVSTLPIQVERKEASTFPIQDKVRDLASKKAAVIFTKSSCYMCYSIKTLFYELGASPAIHEFDHHPSEREMKWALRGLGCDPSSQLCSSVEDS
ncbi:60S ribosomal protein L21-1 [Hibiscus syriacus]|uniref:60S ribosomal protein L21-1 n=1 Tax=Hibiscus syriacus TaxID=106335 RepID=A0A6A3A3U7_HIBSY|nr:60S ribosomal protein L21-1 [Hibiscus syriacus]